MAVLLLCAALPSFLCGPLGLVASALLWVKGYGRAAFLVGVGLLSVLSAWGLVLFAVVGPRTGVAGADAVAAVFAALGFALVGNAVACEGAARAGGEPVTPPGLFYFGGVVVGLGVPWLLGCLVPVISGPPGVLVGAVAGIWVMAGVAWASSGGMFLAVGQAIRLEPVGGYDALEVSG